MKGLTRFIVVIISCVFPTTYTNKKGWGPCRRYLLLRVDLTAKWLTDFMIDLYFERLSRYFIFDDRFVVVCCPNENALDNVREGPAAPA